MLFYSRRGLSVWDEINKKTGVGFMADPKYNPYFFKGEPCSLDYYNKWKKEQEAKSEKATK